MPLIDASEFMPARGYVQRGWRWVKEDPHDCNRHMVELSDGYGWDCAVCWNRGPYIGNCKRGKPRLFWRIVLLPLWILDFLVNGDE